MPQTKRQKQEKALASLYSQLARVTLEIGMYQHKVKFKAAKEYMLPVLENKHAGIVSQIKVLGQKLGVEVKVI